MPMQRPMNHRPDTGHWFHSISPSTKLTAPLAATHPQLAKRCQIAAIMRNNPTAMNNAANRSVKASAAATGCLKVKTPATI
jgi:hypothetical protein